jgi:hypothetical protein
MRWNKELNYLFGLRINTYRGLHETQAFQLLCLRGSPRRFWQPSFTFGSRVLRHRRQLDQTLHGRRQEPTVKTKTETIVGENGKVYSTREEAITAMGKEKICVDSH